MPVHFFRCRWLSAPPAASTPRKHTAVSRNVEIAGYSCRRGSPNRWCARTGEERGSAGWFLGHGALPRVVFLPAARACLPPPGQIPAAGSWAVMKNPWGYSYLVVFFIFLYPSRFCLSWFGPAGDNAGKVPTCGIAASEGLVDAAWVPAERGFSPLSLRSPQMPTERAK